VQGGLEDLMDTLLEPFRLVGGSTGRKTFENKLFDWIKQHHLWVKLPNQSKINYSNWTGRKFSAPQMVYVIQKSPDLSEFTSHPSYWLINTILCTLHYWKDTGGNIEMVKRLLKLRNEPLQWKKDNVLTGVGWTEVLPDDFSFSCGGWMTSLETEMEARNKIKKIFNERLEEYFDSAKRTLKEEGWGKTKKIKLPKQHFEWFIRFQLENWKIGEIADYYYITDDRHIRRVLQETANLLGLSLRDGRGRPKKDIK
jgi:DNA-binding transcriptional MerR regulator